MSDAISDSGRGRNDADGVPVASKYGCYARRMFIASGLAVAMLSCGDDPAATDAAPGDAVSTSTDADRDATLVNLEVSAGTLVPVFDPGITSYTVDVALGIETITVTPTVAVPADVTITVNGDAVASGADSLPIVLDLGPNAIDVVVTASGSAEQTYAIEVTRAAMIAQQAYVKASNTDAYDNFGISVALSGDTLAVGAFGEDSAATGINGDETSNGPFSSGAVYVFARSGATWSQQAYVKASNTDQEDLFGWSVALDGDTLVVGARLEDSAATGIDGDPTDNSAGSSGAVYVFVRSGTTWDQQAYVKASNTDGDDGFGESVAISGDTIVVGGGGEDSAATGIGGDPTDNSAANSGAAYVFVRSGTTWTQQAYVKASNTDAGDGFGDSVAISGDTLVVGARFEQSAATGIGGDQTDNSIFQAGAVYVFVRSGATWSQQAYVKASNTGTEDQFGRSVAIFGDTLAVGASGEDSAATGVGGDQSDGAFRSGAAYVFVRSGTTWSQQAYVKASNTDAFDKFGASVAISDDALAVGAFEESSAATGVDGDQDDNSRPNSGAVYLFVRGGATWSQQAYLKASNTDGADHFGLSVALDRNTVVVGAIEEDGAATGIGGDDTDDGASQSGAAYVFH